MNSLVRGRNLVVIFMGIMAIIAVVTIVMDENRRAIQLASFFAVAIFTYWYSRMNLKMYGTYRPKFNLAKIKFGDDQCHRWMWGVILSWVVVIAINLHGIACLQI